MKQVSRHLHRHILLLLEQAEIELNTTEMLFLLVSMAAIQHLMAKLLKVVVAEEDGISPTMLVQVVQVVEQELDIQTVKEVELVQDILEA